ncbi:PspC domain-containing protein [Rhodococcus tibetensis]|uniref:PspC domain-containing protein n=1 Tax=Rhodococcus tibetensis TaxID=2965064 RepID=A0ABT1QDA8_9NOCA|nr:PspC domain-containing protein [Rhodococcus sp. FXJ9.536]MCQ4120263.1 PspC domain-containing protein [Rhodococcus sp. FXJ9.536]
MSNGSFQEQMQDLWRTRPVRLPGRGHVAGVCAGIGYRYGVDPVLIRVAFVVSTIFGGAGVLLYLVCWLGLTKSGDPASPAESLVGRGHSSDSGTKTVVLLVALAIAASTVGPFGVGLGGSGLISMALMLGGLWLLYQRQPVPPPLPAGATPGVGTGYPGTNYAPGPFGGNPFGTDPYGGSGYGGSAYGAGSHPTYSPYTKLPDAYTPSSTAPAADSAAPTNTPPPTEPAASEQKTVSFEKSPAPDPHSFAPSAPFAPLEPRPPAWDPLGVAPFAWDLPEPAGTTTPAVAPGRRHSRLTTMVIGLAILAAAAATAASVATGSEWLNPGRIGAVALAVIGTGLVIGSFLRKGYGLLVVAGPLVGFVVLASLVGSLNFDGRTMGEKIWEPTSAADLQPEYSGGFGSFTLDLRNVELTEDKTVTVNGNGEVVVIVPPNMNVRNDCTVQFGDTQCLPDGLDGGADGTEGHVLNLDVNAQFGSVEVHRG